MFTKNQKLNFIIMDPAGGNFLPLIPKSAQTQKLGDIVMDLYESLTADEKKVIETQICKLRAKGVIFNMGLSDLSKLEKKGL
ncbi:MAG: hypothetical protein A2513_02805 [Sulfurimonas sp. RIFOXYD12_FULL_33_39]|uniref:hypothetical protein n=1 Tax=unclassified Sulfurimonas TaxID=2623549 RepID=UPI0008D39058|nr:MULTISPECIES: hypothetical protein [unclassified Sulfurimonas]OHE08931.1 MAG: hypothetical protein A2513_02805 [Sulfurimonas sp. RIFOXYD12_FULL_33_39]OHE14241.1 MAG: hypothetical protein A2530_06105 [Sulfurimonas sp. RIFOXYD2_FULL_34_21]DAB28004.1 MAG TPA: hypothetical protein CFH78_04885 [Sulfurimonas sp. UBA10385]